MTSHSYRNSEPKSAELLCDDILERLPRDIWDLPPWNRWSFQHVDAFLKTDTVSASEQALILPKQVLDFDHLKLELPHLGATNLAGFLDATYCDGCLIWHNGYVVYEHYDNDMTSASLHLSQSMAKSVTAAAAGVLVKQGVLETEAQLIQYLPALSGTAYAEATLRHVLDMTSGVRYIEDYVAPDSDIAITDIASGWRPRPPGATLPDNIWEQILTLRTQDCPHGKRWLYRSIETDVLAHCMIATTGKSLPQLVSELLWQPMGAEYPASFTVDAAGYALADGGFNATLQDYARFGLLYLHQGFNLQSESVIPANWVNDTRRGNHQHFAVTGSIGLPDGAYRNQFWIEDSQNRAIMCVGIFGQLIYIQPDREFMFVKLSTWPTALNSEFKIDTLTAIHQLMNSLEE
ncbi:MAG: serine hydrolase [Pseudomonadota bacterium]